MDDKAIYRALGGLRNRITPPGSGDPLRTPACLTYSRARVLALDPAGSTAAESAHAAECRRCGHLLRSFDRQLPHLSIWTLMRRQLDLLRPAEADRVQYHLGSGHCRECTARAERLAGVPLTRLQLPALLVPPHPAMARAAVPEPEVLVRGEHGDLEADLVRDGDELCLEVRTRNPAHRHQLVGYAFASGTGEALVEGYLVLGPDAEEWLAAHELIDPERFRAAAPDGSAALEVAVLPPACLSAEEWRRVRTAAPGPEAAEEVRATWREFCRTQLVVGSLSEDALETVRSIYTSL